MMKYKKPLSDKARFWIGILACAFVGWVASSVSYFSSSQTMDNMYRALFFRSYAYDIFDENECNSLKMNEKTIVNTDIIATTDMTAPFLVRIRYVWGYITYEEDENGKLVETKRYLDSFTDDKGNVVYGGMDICNLDEYSDSPDKGTAKNYGTAENPNFPFLYNKYDGAYYYKGILKTDQLIQHLDSITFRRQWDPDEETGLTQFKDWSDWDIYHLQDDNTWSLDESKLGKGVSLGTGTTVDNGIHENNSYYNRVLLKILVDVVGATDGKGNTLELTGDETADDMESYWNDLNLRLPSYYVPEEEGGGGEIAN